MIGRRLSFNESKQQTKQNLVFNPLKMTLLAQTYCEEIKNAPQAEGKRRESSFLDTSNNRGVRHALKNMKTAKIEAC